MESFSLGTVPSFWQLVPFEQNPREKEHDFVFVLRHEDDVSFRSFISLIHRCEVVLEAKNPWICIGAPEQKSIWIPLTVWTRLPLPLEKYTPLLSSHFWMVLFGQKVIEIFLGFLSPHGPQGTDSWFGGSVLEVSVSGTHSLSFSKSRIPAS